MTSQSTTGLLAGIIVVSLLAAGLLIATVVFMVSGADKCGKRKIKRYYRGEGVRMAAAKRKLNTRPRAWHIGTFNRVLPGSLHIIQDNNMVLSSVDLREFLRRGEPIKIGPQIFVVDTDESRPFTHNTIPLDTSTHFTLPDGRTLPAPGRLVGPTSSGVTGFVCDLFELPYNEWRGPRGGALGYWDEAGNWQAGECDAANCLHWYSPLFMGSSCVQVEAPSPALLAEAAMKE